MSIISCIVFLMRRPALYLVASLRVQDEHECLLPVKSDYDHVLSSKTYLLVAEQSILDFGIPQITFSWVQIKFAKKLNFTADSIARMVTPFYTPVQLQLNTKFAVKDTVVWLLTYHDNFGHLLGEHGPTLHNVLCSYMRRLVTLCTVCTMSFIRYIQEHSNFAYT